MEKGCASAKYRMSDREKIYGESGPTPHVGGRKTSADEARLAEFFVEYRQPLVRFFTKRIGPDADVDDLVQEVFTRIYAQGGQDRLENPNAYIFQVAANLVRDRARRNSTRHEFSRSLAIDVADRVEELSPERVLQGRQKLKSLQGALAELPQRTRAVFLLHRFEGLKYKEIANRLGISTSAVEKHMMAAIRHVAERMGEHDGQG